MSTDNEEAFEMWVTEMPDALDSFLSAIPSDLVAKLDFSPRSLNVLEEWMLEKFGDVARFRNGADTKTVDGIARYIGETFRQNLGGTWDINFSNKKNVYYGMPVIVGLSGKATPECPHFLATTLLDRRTGHF